MESKKKNGTNELIYKTESHTHTHTHIHIYIENKHGYQQWGAGGGRRKCKSGEQDWHTHTAIYKAAD